MYDCSGQKHLLSKSKDVKIAGNYCLSQLFFLFFSCIAVVVVVVVVVAVAAAAAAASTVPVFTMLLLRLFFDLYKEIT